MSSYYLAIVSNHKICSTIGPPVFTTPVFQASAMVLIAPVAIILVAENLGHVKHEGEIESSFEMAIEVILWD